MELLKQIYEICPYLDVFALGIIIILILNEDTRKFGLVVTLLLILLGFVSYYYFGTPIPVGKSF